MLNPPECLFVDDSEVNVRGAAESGMHAIQFKTFPQFMLDLDENFLLSK